MTTRKKTTELVEVDTSYAIAQAAQTLDKVMAMAVDLKDPKAGLEVANGWLTIAALLDLDPEQRQEIQSQESRSLIGFGNHE